MAEQPETRRVSKVENLELAAKVLLDVVWDHPALHPRRPQGGLPPLPGDQGRERSAEGAPVSSSDQRDEVATTRTTDPHDHVVDKRNWLPGPWQEEPDRVQWRTAAGLPGLIVRNRQGTLCGYAAVPPGHPLYGRHYDVADVDVHGGLTYADRCQEDGPICHVPEPGEPDDVWWLGFDCGHLGDFQPGLESRTPPHLRRMGLFSDVYRDLAYVRDQVEQLATQLVEVRDVG